MNLLTILSLTLALLACSPHAPLPSLPHDVGTERSATVAFVTQVNDAFFTSCAGVWVGETEVITAAHCIDGGKPGELVSFAMFEDVLRPEYRVTESHSIKILRVDTAHDLMLLGGDDFGLTDPHACARCEERVVDLRDEGDGGGSLGGDVVRESGWRCGVGAGEQQEGEDGGSHIASTFGAQPSLMATVVVGTYVAIPLPSVHCGSLIRCAPVCALLSGPPLSVDPEAHCAP